MKFERWLLMGALLVFPWRAFAHGPNPAEFEADRAAAFQQADADGNGSLSVDEFKAFETILHDKMATQHFTHLDANGDGVVTLDELQSDHHGPGSGPPPCDR